MQNKILRPRSVTSRNENILEYCLSRAKFAEPVSVVGMSGNGITINFEQVAKKIEETNSGYNFYELVASSDDQLQSLLEKMDQDNQPKILIVLLSTGKDEYWFIKECEKRREKNGTDFVYLIFSDIVEAYSSLQTKNIAYSKFITFLKPLDYPDVQRLVKEFARRFKHSLSKSEVRLVYKISGGHVGMTKSLYFYLRDGSEIKNISDILNNFSIRTRLENMLLGLTKQDMYDLRNGRHNDVLSALGFVANGKIFSVLLKKYLESIFDYSYKNTFTSVETGLLELMKNKDEIVDRQEIAETIWGENWEEKYSDWAIDQNMHRLRKKLRESKSVYNIVTKKGRGYVLQEK